jgi:hypothetical protein
MADAVCLSPEQRNELAVEERVRQRLPLGAVASKRALLDELVRFGLSEWAVERAILAMCQRGEVEYLCGGVWRQVGRVRRGATPAALPRALCGGSGSGRDAPLSPSSHARPAPAGGEGGMGALDLRRGGAAGRRHGARRGGRQQGGTRAARCCDSADEAAVRGGAQRGYSS